MPNTAIWDRTCNHMHGLNPRRQSSLKQGARTIAEPHILYTSAKAAMEQKRHTRVTTYFLITSWRLGATKKKSVNKTWVEESLKFKDRRACDYFLVPALLTGHGSSGSMAKLKVKTTSYDDMVSCIDEAHA